MDIFFVCVFFFSLFAFLLLHSPCNSIFFFFTSALNTCVFFFFISWMPLELSAHYYPHQYSMNTPEHQTIKCPCSSVSLLMILILRFLLLFCFVFSWSWVLSPVCTVFFSIYSFLSRSFYLILIVSEQYEKR